jgi:hypothetical protein
VAGEPVNGEPTDGTPGEIRVPQQVRGEIHMPDRARGACAEVSMPSQVRDEPRTDAPMSSPVRDERRGEVVLRHARLTGRGRPTFCSPTRAEQAGVVRLAMGNGTDGKVIYPTREAAEAAARELESLGARRLRPYLCARSRHGHFHLATDTSRPLHERIPEQRRPA